MPSRPGRSIPTAVRRLAWVGGVAVAALLAATAPSRADDAETLRARGAAAEAAGDYLSALEAYVPLARAGDVAAQLKVADFLAEGRGVPRNHDLAVTWYKAALVSTALAQQEPAPDGRFAALPQRAIREAAPPALPAAAAIESAAPSERRAQQKDRKPAQRGATPGLPSGGQPDAAKPAAAKPAGDTATKARSGANPVRRPAPAASEANPAAPGPGQAPPTPAPQAGGNWTSLTWGAPAAPAKPAAPR